jgi:hypothetical protein
MPQPTPGARQVMLGELIDLVSGVAMGEQGDKAKDILGRVYEYFLLHYVRMERLSNETLPVQEWRYFIRKGAPVSYRYSFEDLLALLHGHAPAKVDAVALHRRRVEHGHLSVGLKIHCLGDGSQFSTLVEGLGGAQKILDVNYYKHSHASLCLVLPPVGSARSAYSFLSVSSTLLDLRFSVTRKSRSRYVLQGDLALVVRHCWR